MCICMCAIPTYQAALLYGMDKEDIVLLLQSRDLHHHIMLVVLMCWYQLAGDAAGDYVDTDIEDVVVLYRTTTSSCCTTSLAWYTPSCRGW